jgi:hypothetical protein
MIIPPLLWMPALRDMTTHLWAAGWSWWGVGSSLPPDATPTPGLAPVVPPVPPVPPTDPPDATFTDHALLVLLGAYAQDLGVIDHLAQMPLAQRTHTHAPQDKLIQFLVGILGGLDYLQYFDTAAHPLTRDPLVAQAWNQTAFAHYSGVSRTLAAADADTLTAVTQRLRAITQPLVDAEVLALLQSDQPLWLDVDLVGRSVSPTSTSYPDADFGWMDDGVAKGYQTALTSLAGGSSGRILLSSQRYPGRTHSAACLHAAICAAEQVVGGHPQRRTDLVQTRLDALAADRARAEDRQQALATQQQTLDAAITAAVAAQAAVTRLEADPVPLARADRPHRRLSRAHSRVSTQVRRQERLQQRLATLAVRQHRADQQVAILCQQEAALQAWHDQLATENTGLIAPLPLVVRVDAGFSTDDNLTWLIAMGYAVVTKVHNGQTTTRMRRSIAADVAWDAVGRNAEAVPWAAQRVATCPYPLEALVVRYHLPDRTRYTTLLSYGRADMTAPQWFQQYNARQVIEAGIKEQLGLVIPLTFRPTSGAPPQYGRRDSSRHPGHTRTVAAE